LATAPIAADRRPSAESSRLTSAEAHALRRVILAGGALRLGCAVVLHWTGYSRLLAPDERTYAEEGWAITLYWLGDVVTRPWRYSSGEPIGYFQLNALFFAIFGHTEIPIKIATALIGAFTIRYVYLIARELYGPSVAHRAALYAAYLPSLVLWSSVNIRDAWVIFLLVVACWLGLSIQKGGSPLVVVKYALIVFIVSRFRDYLVYILLITPVAALLMTRGEKRSRNFLVATVISLVGLVMIQQGIVGHRTENRLSLEAIAELRQSMATGGSAFQAQADISTPGAALLFLPIGLAYFLFSPFPWQITSLLKAISLPEMLFLYSLTPAIIRGLLWTFRRRFQESSPMLLLIGLIAASYALSSGNVGTMYRHRAQALVFFLILAALGMQVRGRPHSDPRQES
jgi:4-amino-4-deoxy-L-arabinose transferase-like glycosyltransferase